MPETERLLSTFLVPNSSAGQRRYQVDAGSALELRPRTHWLEPVPDARVIPPDADPAERAVLRPCIA